MKNRLEEPQAPVRRETDLLTAVDLSLQYGITLQRARGLFDKGVIPTTQSGPRRRVTTRRAFLDWRAGKTPEARAAVPPAPVPPERSDQRPRPEGDTSNAHNTPVIPMRADDDLLSCTDLSREYGLPRDFARKLIHGGIIRSIPVGERKRVTTRCEFRKWQEASLSFPESGHGAGKGRQGTCQSGARSTLI